MNLVVLKGNVTRDIEVKFTPKGAKVGTFGLAMNRKWKDKNTGELREKVIFVDVQVWKETCDFVQNYFPKGSPMLITGSLEMDQWEDKETGKNRTRLFVRPDQIEFCGSKREGGAGTKPRQAPARDEAGRDDTGNDGPPEDHEIREENIPF